MTEKQESSPDRVEEYIQLLAENEASLRLYIISMIPVIADAEDILQDTKMTIWKDFFRYETGTHFGAWARKIAYNRILAFRKKKAIENKKLVFSEEFYEVVDQHTESLDGSLNERMNRLIRCMSKLQDSHRQAMSLKYQKGLTIEEVADRLNRSVTATYRLISRVRQSLKDCVHMQEQVV